MDKFPITINGFKKLNEELDNLKKNDRPKIIQAISEARELGDLSENAEYHAAREKQSFIEGRIIELEDKIARAEVIDVTKLSGNQIKFGATVKIVDEDTDEEATYQIVGEYEADFNESKISIVSPLARALIGKQPGDSFELKTPKGMRYFEILEVKYI
ncbi:transcription elongation factor GreA [Rickettsiales endosymbiont of Stachyamoeba lipophora]|uniref:transcription elongation factor GreA n=1 Tax=Rickettsiales endosymbiont of Stachyamoeba lipophora TaxID=2486578 RepID=UPI000F655060|nr:transcription elongation factor GreA [Rickettsiales endosymbiont of Stachyamoeba lipophora]AZL16283.1 transcription elongation factor GreA [Rickettsiales endosymbiont of Stachyamoeba lipophora]